MSLEVLVLVSPQRIQYRRQNSNIYAKLTAQVVLFELQVKNKNILNLSKLT